MRLKTLLAVASACMLLGACSYKEEKRVVTPDPAAATTPRTVVTPAPASASDTCVSRGYRSGTAAYDDCVTRLSRP
ncbi:hypothetical protein [Reyranella sp. CPCC 100927]|uniref:hypothetical protein n=1 Tax=Reyranella sp. CPCC 100927 TaxID=2599616 RepID=UPI0011B36A84|nr:hypothetical protein [Reyranella sp. CPCC 100927]TWT03137.1 hypothetical protein FQU96_28785 [Reyranella sp. CPCC 100927]